MSDLKNMNLSHLLNFNFSHTEAFGTFEGIIFVADSLVQTTNWSFDQSSSGILSMILFSSALSSIFFNFSEQSFRVVGSHANLKKYRSQ